MRTTAAHWRTAEAGVGYQRFLGLVEQANPTGTIMLITDNLSSHHSVATREWLADHPRIQHAFIPTGACWLNLQEGWWRLFAAKPLPGSRLPPLRRSRWPPEWRPASSTPAPARGSGAAHHRPTPPTAGLHVPPLRNGALETCFGR